MICFITRPEALSKASEELANLMIEFESKNEVQNIESLVPKPFPRYADLNPQRQAIPNKLKNQCTYLDE